MENTKDLRRYTTLPVLLDMLVRNQLTLLAPDNWADVNDRNALGIYQQALHYGFVGAMCLTQAAETFHHWEVFAGGGGGVAVVFDRGEFEALFENQAHFIAAPVQYIKLNEIGEIEADDIHRLPFLKRWGFRHEEEYRLLGYTVEKRRSLVAPMPRNLIKRVIFSPFAHPTLVESATLALRALAGWKTLRVGHSHLTDNQTWQKALRDFPSRHGTIYGPWIDTQIDFGEGTPAEHPRD
ncbi:MAG TPA: hypothetical protein VGC35_12735 [Allosphingosinicella sp.]|jgi:hypothetical protein